MRVTSSSDTSGREAPTSRPVPDAHARDATPRVPPPIGTAQENFDPLEVDPAELPAAGTFLAEMLRMGCTIEVVGTAVVWFGPVEAMSPEIRGRVLFWKPELVALLRCAGTR